jgi:phthalate 4,5-dioxygenase
MGPISDRSQDHPGASDLAVAQFRRLMVAALKKFQEGGPALGTTEQVSHLDLASFEGLVPKTTDWRTLGGGAATAESSEGALARS